MSDVVGCFDNIHHDLLLTILSSFINDSRFINLISAFIKTDILDKTEKNYAGGILDNGLTPDPAISRG